MLDPANGLAVTILFDKDNIPACWYNLPDPNAGDNTLTCIAGNVNKTAVKRRAAIFSFKKGMVLQKKILYDMGVP